MLRKATILLSIAFLFNGAASARFATQLNQVRSFISGGLPFSLPPDVQADLISMVDMLEDLSDNPDFPADSFEKLYNSMLCYLQYALSFWAGLPPGLAEEAVSELQDIKLDTVGESHALMTNPFPNVFIVAPPEADCTVSIFLVSGGEQHKNGRISGDRNMVLKFKAVGRPDGGTYSWSLNPSDPDVAGLSTFTSGGNQLPRAGMLAKRRGTYNLMVEYTAPDGKMCKVTQEIRIRN